MEADTVVHPPPTELVKVYRLTMRGRAGFLAVGESALDALLDAVVDSEPGDRYTITVQLWHPKKLAELPEWDGW